MPYWCATLYTLQKSWSVMRVLTRHPEAPSPKTRPRIDATVTWCNDERNGEDLVLCLGWASSIKFPYKIQVQYIVPTQNK